MICCLEALGKSNIVRFPWSGCEDDIGDEDEFVDILVVFVCESSVFDVD